MNKNMISRRAFLKLINYALSSSFLLTYSCGAMTPKIDGGLDEIADDYEFFNKQNPNLKLGAGTYGSFFSTFLKYGFNHEGIRYNANKFFACASGAVYSAGRRTMSGDSWNKDSGDGVVIMHGRDLYVDYYHMQIGSCKLKAGDLVKRGDYIGESGAPNNMHMKLVVLTSDPNFLSAVNLGQREDPDNYGHRLGYMQYWDGKERLDLSYDEVAKRKKTQMLLIKNFVRMYDGPLADEVHKGLSVTVFGRIFLFSPIDEFKFVKYLYEKDPSTFRGNNLSIGTLIEDIYENQPIVLTLPFK